MNRQFASNAPQTVKFLANIISSYIPWCTLILNKKFLNTVFKRKLITNCMDAKTLQEIKFKILLPAVFQSFIGFNTLILAI